MNYRSLLVFILALVAVLPACDLVDSDEFEQEVLVEAYLVAREALPEVRLSRTVPLDAPFRFSDVAIDGAGVRIELLREDGSVEATYPYAQRVPGIYIPLDTNSEAAIVQPERSYRLVADVGGTPVTSTTRIPGAFDVVETTPGDTVVFQGADQFAARVTRSAFPGRQNIFVFTARALGELDSTRLTPAYAAFTDDDDDPEDLRVTSSPPLNEANYDVNPDGTLTIRLPWLSVAFYGTNEVSVNAVDDNLFDFLRSLQVQQGGSTLGPGEIPDIIDNVENGTGVFGSMARVTERVTIVRD